MSRIELLAGERKPGESSRAVEACNDYLRLGVRRSLKELLEKYIKVHKDTYITASLDTLLRWSSRFDWKSRAKDYDARIEIERNLALEAQRKEVMESGLALDFERVLKLKELAAFLESEIKSEDDEGRRSRVWMPDVKQIGGGQYAERVDIERFNSALFDQYRGTLDDIARETGGRRSQMEHTGKNGGPIESVNVGMTVQEWEKRRADAQGDVEKTLHDFDDEVGGDV